MNTLTAYKNEINALCANHKVKSLYAFGSVLTPQFNSHSDIDLLVDFDDVDVNEYADNYFDFKFSLQEIFNRPIDLLEAQAIKNPYFKQVVNQTKELVYGYWDKGVALNNLFRNPKQEQIALLFLNINWKDAITFV